MSKVYFAPARPQAFEAEATLPAKLEKILEAIDLPAMVRDKVVAVKLHLGGNLGYTTVHPLFVRLLVQKIKEAGGKPFVTDTPGSAYTAAERGYAAETIGCPVYAATGLMDKYFYRRPVDYQSLKEIEIAGYLADADVLINFSHVKGHGNAGFGGAIKNLGMGAVTAKSRRDIHALSDTEPRWDESKCIHCSLCEKNCRGKAISFDAEGKMRIFMHNCIYCMRCVFLCPQKAVQVDREKFREFQYGLALATREVLATFAPGRVFHLNLITNVTPICDCFGFSPMPIIPDVGLLGAADIVAIEQASLDLINQQPLLPNSLPPGMDLAEEGVHLFQRLWRKDPYGQVEAAAALGLGERKYELVEI